MKRISAILLAAGLAGSSMAGLTTSYTDMGNLSSTVLSQTSSVSVAVGDVVVMVGGSNKKDSVAPIAFSSTAGSFINLGANAQLGTDPNPDAYLSYLVIGTGGTYDFIGTCMASSATANLGLYKLTADSGFIELAGSNAKKYSGLAVGESLSVTNFISWNSNPNVGDYEDVAVIGVASSLRGDISTLSLTLDESNASKRLAGITTLTSGVNYKTIWDITNGDATNSESGGITGAAFAEVIPEPATLGLISSIGFVILFIRRRFMI